MQEDGHPGEKVMEGPDGLREPLAKYAHMGTRFARWRSVIASADGIPSHVCIEANADALARYAALSQEANLAQIAEPKVVMAGEHTLGQCGKPSERVLRAVFEICPSRSPVDDIADATLRCLSAAGAC